MDILKAFVINKQEHNVTILWKNGRPLFRASEVGDIIELKNIRMSLSDFDEDEKVVSRFYTVGGEQECIFLTEIGVYRLLMRSTKPIARPFQKWVSNVIATIRETGEYKLQQEIERIEKDAEERIATALAREAQKYKDLTSILQHNALVDAFRDRYVVYFGKIRDMEDGRTLIKIGSTKLIKQRSNDLIIQHGTYTMFKVFECACNEAFEKFLHHHPDIIQYRYQEPVYDNYVSNGEIFLVPNDDIRRIVNIAKRNRYKFVQQVEAETLVEMERIKLQQAQAHVEELKLQQNDKNAITIDIDPIMDVVNERNHTQSRGDKIQRYCADGKTLLATYESYAFAIRDDTLPNPTRSGIKEAIKNNAVYKGYRWATLDRDQDDATVQDLPPSTKTITVNNGFVAMLDFNHNIAQVFCDQKEAAKNRQFSSTASISNAIKRGTKSGGHYFKMWHDCDASQQEAYLQSNELPQKRATHAFVIERLHPITKDTIERFSSYEDVIKKYKCSRTTLKNALTFDYVLRGFRWKMCN